MQRDPLTGLVAARTGLYVHFPYCLRRCPYCDFAIRVQSEVPGARYADAVLAELDLRLGATAGLAGRTLDSVYVGGGTPSLWGPAEVGRVLEGVARRLTVATDAEISLEANPEVADAERLAGYRAAGVNRLSLGVQSFDAATLATLGRAHRPEDGRAAVAAARTAGFDDVSLDLILGAPGQSVDAALADARAVAALAPEHVSAYVLTVEREHLGSETLFSRRLRQGRLALPDDDAVVAMVDGTDEVLTAAGLARYEISSWARPGRHARHNASYWTGGETLALGASAVGLLRDGDGALRTRGLRSVTRWLDAVERGELPVEETERLDAHALATERLLLGLRLRSGLDLEALWSEGALTPRRDELERLVRDGFLERTEGRVRLTRRGAHLHAEVSARLA